MRISNVTVCHGRAVGHKVPATASSSGRPAARCHAAPQQPQATCNTVSEVPAVSRRSALTSAAGSALMLCTPLMGMLQQALPAQAAPKDVDWAALRKDIMALIADPAQPGPGIGAMGPTLVRLAWHSSGSYDKMTRTGGSNGGTIRFKEELAHGGNAGFEGALALLDPLHEKYPGLSYADLYTYAGAVAIEAMNGPAIPWRAGRVDALDPSAVTPDGRLPSPDEGSPPRTAAALRKTFGRMGFDDREIVALSGAHALGRCHAEASGYVGPWTGTPTIFSNLYFKLLLKANWTPDPRYPKFQYKDDSGTLMMLPSDLVLIQDPEFRKYTELYAKEKKTFYADFSVAYAKLLELGTSNLVSVA